MLFLSGVGRKIRDSEPTLQFSLCCSVRAQSKTNQSVRQSHCQLGPAAWPSPAPSKLRAEQRCFVLCRDEVSYLHPLLPVKDLAEEQPADQHPPSPGVDLEEPSSFVLPVLAVIWEEGGKLLVKTQCRADLAVERLFLMSNPSFLSSNLSELCDFLF